jgi:hypothetical protein
MVEGLCEPTLESRIGVDRQSSRQTLEREAWVCERAAALLGQHPDAPLAAVVAQAKDEWEMYMQPKAMRDGRVKILSQRLVL